MKSLKGGKFLGYEIKEVVKEGKTYSICRISDGRYGAFEKKDEWVFIYLSTYEDVMIRYGHLA